MKKILTYCFLLLMLQLVFGDKPVYSLDMAPETGKYAPLFTLKDLDRKDVSLSSFRGKVVLLNFWATWCGPCKSEMPSLNRLYLSFKDKGFMVIGVAIDPSEKPVRSLVSEKRIGYPVLMDKDKEVYFDDYAAFGLPISFLIDRHGVITQKIIGEQDWNSSVFKATVEDLLRGK